MGNARSQASYAFLDFSAATYAADFARDAVRDALTASRTSDTAPTAEADSNDCHNRSLESHKKNIQQENEKLV